MKLIYTLILLLFSSSVLADFLYVKSSISDLLGYGFEVKQIDILNYSEHVFHLKLNGSTTIAICYIYFRDTNCMIDTKNKKLLELLNEIEISPLIKLTGDDYLEQLNKEILAEEMDD